MRTKAGTKVIQKEKGKEKTADKKPAPAKSVLSAEEEQKLAWDQWFRKYLRETADLDPISNEGHGRCLWRCFSQFMHNGSESRYAEYLFATVGYVADNWAVLPEAFRADAPDLQTYLQNLLRPVLSVTAEGYGTQAEIKAFAELFNV
jgi:hypothetical protein